MELFLTLKLYLHKTELLYITAWINWIVWNRNVFDKLCIHVNWLFLKNRTDYLHKNGFGVK